MTHTLHRSGRIESLKNDYVVLVMSCRGFNDEGAAPTLVKALDVMSKFDPINMGDMKTGSIFTRGYDYRRIVEKATDTSVFHAVYPDIGTVRRVLKALKEADLGMSVVVSGLYKEIDRASRAVSLAPHTVNISLGVWGRTDLLPKEPEVMDILTMCGHAMVSRNLVRKLVGDVRRGKITSGEAAKMMAKCCTCGIFNWKRAAELIDTLIERG